MARRRLFIAALTLALVATGCFDSMYPTSNASWNCRDGDLNNGDPGVFCWTDNRGLTYYMQGTLESGDKTNIRNAMGDSYSPTVLNPDEHNSSEVSYSGSAETDIIYQEGPNVPTDSIGWTWCDDGSGKQCDQHYVQWDDGLTVTQATACHETGHAVGLVHGPNSSPKVSFTNSLLGCMKRPSGNNTYLSEHNQKQINNTY